MLCSDGGDGGGDAFRLCVAVSGGRGDEWRITLKVETIMSGCIYMVVSIFNNIVTRDTTTFYVQT